MDQSHGWSRGRDDRRAGRDGSGTRRSDASKSDAAEKRGGASKWHLAPETGRWLAAGHLAGADAEVAYRIDGWLAKQGTSVWFGAGSTGKTQLMLWMAATLASRPDDRREDTWLGRKVNGTGHVLILSAEDTREQIMGRIRDMVIHSLGQDEVACLRTCARLHVLPFLSMSEEDFAHPNPSIFEPDGAKVWRPSEVMEEIEGYIYEWNRLHPNDDDRIIGVIMDSATSMSGFDSLDAQATTNFFFYLGRLCERMRIFWAVIGHTPKTTSIGQHTWRDTAASRLRGVAMWTTAPRLTVEVRLAQEWRSRKGAMREAAGFRTPSGEEVRREDLLVVYVAKANLKGANRRERYLARLGEGAFVDVTDQSGHLRTDAMVGVGKEKNDDPQSRARVEEALTEAATPSHRPSSSASRGRRASSPGAGRPKTDPSYYAPGTPLVLELLLETYPAPNAGVRVVASGIERMIRDRRELDDRATYVTSSSGGGKSPVRVGALGWHMRQLEAAGVLRKVGRYFHMTGIGVDRESTPPGGS